MFFFSCCGFFSFFFLQVFYHTNKSNRKQNVVAFFLLLLLLLRHQMLPLETTLFICFHIYPTVYKLSHSISMQTTCFIQFQNQLPKSFKTSTWAAIKHMVVGNLPLTTQGCLRQLYRSLCAINSLSLQVKHKQRNQQLL